MLGLPKATELNKALPKKAIYAKFNMNTAAKEKFDADIARIVIAGEISAATSSIAAGQQISSIFVLHVQLKRKNYDPRTIAQISKLIEQNMLLVLEYGEQRRLAIYHTKLIQTNWMPAEACTVKLSGLDLDAVWENLIVQVGEIRIEDGKSLDQQMEADERREKLQKEIAKLEKQAWAEKQPKKKFELVQRIKKLYSSLD